MAQFGLIVYSPAPADPMTMSAEYLEALARYPDRAKELGAKVLGGSYFPGQRGFAFEASTTATAISGEEVRSGPLVEGDLVVSAFFVVSAPTADVAVELAKAHPATHDGGVEVRPLFPAPAEKPPKR